MNPAVASAAVNFDLWELSEEQKIFCMLRLKRKTSVRR
jgi:hypothetical protein